MIHKVVNSKIKNGKQIYSVLYEDDPTKEVHFLTKEEVTAQENGEELISNFLKARNEKKKIRSIEKIYGCVNPSNSERLFAVKFNDSNKIDVVSRKELKKYNIDALIQFYESHIDFLHDKIEEQKQKHSKPKSHHNQPASNSPNNHKQQPPPK